MCLISLDLKCEKQLKAWVKGWAISSDVKPLHGERVEGGGVHNPQQSTFSLIPFLSESHN